jgi:hypothetical protein
VVVLTLIDARAAEAAALAAVTAAASAYYAARGTGAEIDRLRELQAAGRAFDDAFEAHRAVIGRCELETAA